MAQFRVLVNKYYFLLINCCTKFFIRSIRATFLAKKSSAINSINTIISWGGR